jgi:hypothetical protein
MTMRFTLFGPLLIAGLTGCAANAPPRNSVSGKVTINERLVTEGMVTFHGADGHTANGAIAPNGGYTIDDPPLGLCEITVEAAPGLSYAVDPVEHGVKPDTNTRPSQVPAKYARPGNGLQIDVKPGQHVRNLQLSDQR